MVVDPEKLISELDALVTQNVETRRLCISNHAHYILPTHKLLDQMAEERRGDKKIGTTGKGIGPAYRDKVNRVGIRMGDAADAEGLMRKIDQHLADHVTELGQHEWTRDKLHAHITAAYQRLAPHICDTSALINDTLDRGGRVLLEGAQGTLLDVDHGTYPFVTSSSPTAGGACIGAGIGPTRINRVLGVTKAYSTRVGSGPMPTELNDDVGEGLRARGHEFGTTTGRSRRCGWLDLVALRYAVRINGMTHLALTKLDVLDACKELKMCVAYRVGDQETRDFPADDATLCQVAAGVRVHARLGVRHHAGAYLGRFAAAGHGLHCPHRRLRARARGPGEHWCRPPGQLLPSGRLGRFVSAAPPGLVSTACFACSLSPCSIGTPEPVPLRAVTIAPQGTPWELIFERIRRDINATGKVRMKVQYGVKDSEPALAAAVANGEVDMIAITTAGLAGHLPALQALELPFLFDTPEEADYVLDKHVREPVAARARDHNMVFYNWSENGWQNFATVERVIMAPKDLVGLRMRSQPAPMHLMTWQTFGALPVPLEPNQVAAAFKAGKLDGLAQTPVYMLAAGWQSAVHHLTLSHHLYQPAAMVYSRKFFEAQSADVQKLLLANAATYTEDLRKMVRGMEPDILAGMQKQGIKIHTLTARDRAAFVTVARRVQNKFVNTAPAEALDLLSVIVKGKAAYASPSPSPFPNPSAP